MYMYNDMQIYKKKGRFYNTFLADALSTALEPGSLAKSSKTCIIFALVSMVSRSMSAAVRPVVGIGGSTIPHKKK